MKLIALAFAACGAFVAVTTATAVPFTGTTKLLDPPKAGTTVNVDVSVTTNSPVVAYEFAIQNECTVAGKPGRTIQHDDIVYWTSDVGGVPHATMPIYLQSIPGGSDCKVFLVKNNTVVKGSTTPYSVVP